MIRFSSAGDIVLASPLLRVLRRQFPDSVIDFAVKEEYAGLVRTNPNVSSLLVLPRGTGMSAVRALRRTIRERRYDLVVDIHGSLRSRYIAAGLPRVVRVRKRVVPRSLLLRWKVDVYDRFGGSPPVAERYLETVASLGVRADGEGLEVFPTASDVRDAQRALDDAGIRSQGSLVLGLAPAARHGNKMWPAGRFAEVGATLVGRLGASVLLLGGGDDAPLCAEVKAAILERAPGARVGSVAGMLGFLGTAAALDSCTVVVSNDSAVMHLAAARKRPLVALFGPTVSQFGFFPYGTRSIVLERKGLACRPCTHVGLPSCPEGHFRCMNDTTTNDVVESILALTTP